MSNLIYLIYPAQLGGRCANGNERDHGSVVHAVEGFGPQNLRDVALCGRRYGRRSVGFCFAPSSPISCPRCAKKVAVMKTALSAQEQQG